MRAIIAREPGGPDVLEPTDVARPERRTGEVVIEVVAAGVNRADLLQRQGAYPPPPGASSLIGLEVSGRIAEVGPEITGWSVGDACVALLAGGGYAEYVAAPAGQVVISPPGVDLIAAAGVIEVAATVLSNLDLAHLAAGEVLLVHGGAGGIGSFAIQYARALGATVVTTAGSEAKLDYCRSMGADHAISYRGDWASGVRAALEGRGVDVVLDNMGARYLEEHIRLLAAHGRLVVIGLQAGRKGTLDLGALMACWGSVTATTLRSRSPEAKAEICRHVVERAWPLIESGAITLPPLTSYPLGEAAAAHARLESGDNLGKIVLTCRTA